ncbi:hypothetical protein [Streptomyces cinerochromogenes]|uniref:hypothetical protein n=1 Tax=Streptomyces cinerochromogenes TaxID=66422 RepID=UPI0016704A1A|nr:hypothetical protein [Streptomyces cinerochromogenes]GGS55142.1 hypothetical protein GCM10010206_16110 [Streptomyces cinerochromogenes]
MVWALALVTVFGALAPTLAPVTVQALTGHLPQIVPARIFFGPAALRGYLVLRRSGPERRMADLRPPAPCRRTCITAATHASWGKEPCTVRQPGARCPT